MRKSAFLMAVFLVMVMLLSNAMADSWQWRQLYDSAQDSFRSGRVSQSLSMAKDSLRKADLEFGADSLYALKSLVLLGDLTKAYGSYSESARFYKRALDTQQKLFGATHPNNATVLNSLASVNMNLGNIPEASAQFSKAIEISKLSGHGSDPCVADSLIGLASLDRIANNPELSEKNLVEALSILDFYSKYKPSINLTIANARVSLADSLKAQAKYQDSARQYRAAIKYFETRGMASSGAVTECLIAMGDSYVSSGKKARALDCFKRALVSSDSTDNMTTALVSRRLAGLYRSMGNIPEARRYLRQAVATLETCSPSGCPLLADTQKSLKDLTEKGKSKDGDTSA